MGTVYQWGDAGESKAEALRASPPSPLQAEVGANQPRERQVRDGARSANDKAGGPQLGSGPDGQRDGASQASEMAETLAQVQIIATGVSSLAKSAGELAHFVRPLAAGPVGMVVMLAWKLFKHGMSYFEMLRNMLNDVLVVIDTIMDIIAPYMPDWWNRIVGFFQDDPPSLLDALLGADDVMRDAVHAGEHRYLPPDARAEMIDTMMSGYCGDADEQCICEVLGGPPNGDECGRRAR